jgi:APA family basic amino acid/polyamine antiporter
MFAIRGTDDLPAETKETGHTLKRAIGAFDLTAIGIGSIIGTGIFIIIAEGVSDAGLAPILPSCWPRWPRGSLLR